MQRLESPRARSFPIYSIFRVIRVRREQNQCRPLHRDDIISYRNLDTTN